MWRVLQVDFGARVAVATLDSQEQQLQLSLDSSLAGYVALNHEVGCGVLRCGAV